VPLARPRDQITTREDPEFAHLRAHGFAELKATKAKAEAKLLEVVDV